MSWVVRSYISSRTWVMNHETLATWTWILVAPTLILWAAGAEWWSPPYTPDSEFYYSLGIFGSDITDRALQPAYYWTRLGWILPVHLLVDVFGVSIGFAVWHWILTTLAVAPTFLLVRRVAGALAAGAASLLMASSTVFIVTTGNTYVISLLLPLMVLVSATSALLAMEDRRWRRVVVASTCGAAIGWIAMTNTIAAAYGALIVLVAAAVGIGVRRRWRDLRDWLLSAFALILTLAGTLLVFLGWGRLVFPDLDWWGTVLYWSRILDSSLYRDNSFAWVNQSVILLSLPVVIGAGVAVLAWRPAQLTAGARMAVTALTASAAAALALALFQEFQLNSAVLQIPTYYPILWGPLLPLAAVLFGVVLGSTFRRGLAAGVATTAVLFFVSILVGRVESPIRHIVGWGLALCIAGIAAWVLAERASRRVGGASAVIAVGALAIPVALLQLFPNSGPSPGLYTAAFNPTPSTALYSLDAEIASWVLRETTPEDTLMVWAYPGQANLSGAAMNLWGPNAVGPLQETLTTGDAEVLRANNVTALAMYAPTRLAIDASLAGLGDAVESTVTGCRVARDRFHEVHVCVIRLTS